MAFFYFQIPKKYYDKAKYKGVYFMQVLKMFFVVSLFLIGFGEPLSADDYVHSNSDSVEKSDEIKRGGGRGRRGRRGYRGGRRGRRYRGGMGRGYRGGRRGYRGPRRGRGYRGPRRRYSRYRHRPYRRWRSHHSRWYYPYYYYNSIPYHYVWWNYWVRYPYQYPDGYIWHSSYPYFAYNGYLHRYSNVDICNYELVDATSKQTVESYHGQICNVGYDICAQQRDEMNYQSSNYRYFCSERYSNRNGNLD